MTEGWRRQCYIKKQRLYCKIDDFAAKRSESTKLGSSKARECKDQRVQMAERAREGY